MKKLILAAALILAVNSAFAENSFAETTKLETKAAEKTKEVISKADKEPKTPEAIKAEAESKAAKADVKTKEKAVKKAKKAKLKAEEKAEAASLKSAVETNKE